MSRSTGWTRSWTRPTIPQGRAPCRCGRDLVPRAVGACWIAGRAGRSNRPVSSVQEGWQWNTHLTDRLATRCMSMMHNCALRRIRVPVSRCGRKRDGEYSVGQAQDDSLRQCNQDGSKALRELASAGGVLRSSQADKTPADRECCKVLNEFREIGEARRSGSHSPPRTPGSANKQRLPDPPSTSRLGAVWIHHRPDRSKDVAPLILPVASKAAAGHG